MRSEFSFWLIPEEHTREALQNLIDDLASRNNAVRFEPHVTAYCGPSDDDEVNANAQAVVARLAPILLFPKAVEFSRIFTKTLFVQFERSDTLQVLASLIMKGCRKPTSYELNPHLSLMYKSLPESELAILARNVDIPDGPYRFDALQVIETEVPVTESDAVERWRYVRRVELATR